MAEGLQEYVIKLSTQIDNPGVSQLFSILNSNKLMAMGLTSALAGVTTAVYKFIASAAKQELAMADLAKQQKKSVEQTRAEQEALKSMGKTLEEINKDKNLKAIYDDLVKFNKEMALPNTNQTVEKIQKIQGAFQKLRSAVNYATKWIGHQVLVNLEQPMERITTKMEKITKWIRDNMPIISSKIGVFISDFAKGITGIVEGVGKIFEWIGKLPTGIKAISAALVGLIALIKSGPIGQILALVTAIGDVIHDYEVYQWDKKNGLKPGDANYVRNLNDQFPIWDAFSENGIGGIGSLILTKINEELANMPAEEMGKGFGEAITKVFAYLADQLNGTGGPTGILGQLVGVGKNLAKGIFNFVSSALTTITLNDVQTPINSIITNIFGYLSEGLYKSMDLILGKKKGENEYEKGLIQYGEDLFLSIIKAIRRGSETFGGEELGVQIGQIVNSIFTKIGDFFADESKLTQIIKELEGTGKTVAKGVFKFISSALGTIEIKDIDTSVKSITQNIFKNLSEGINSAINLLIGNENEETGEYEKGLLQYGKDIFSSILTFIEEGSNKLTGVELGTQLGTIVNNIFQRIGEFLIKETSSKNGKRLTGQLATIGKNIARSVFEFFSTAIGTVNYADARDSVNAIITKVFGVLSTGLNDAMDLFFGSKNEETGEYEKGLLQYGEDLFSNIIEAIGRGAETIGDSELGTQIGSIVNNVFTKIGNYLSSGVDNMKKIFPEIINTITKIGEGMANFFSDVVAELAKTDEETGKTGFASFADGIWTAITTGLDELHRRLTNVEADDFIDVSVLEDIGTKIGESIGTVIDIGIQWIETLPEKIKTWLDGGGLQRFVDIGTTIGEAIIGGLANLLGATLARSLLGDEGYKVYESMQKSTATATVEEGSSTAVVKDTTGLKIERTFNSEEAAKAYAAQAEGEGNIIRSLGKEADKNAFNLTTNTKTRVLPETYDPELFDQIKFMGNNTNTAAVNTFGWDALYALIGKIESALLDHEGEEDWDKVDSAMETFLGEQGKEQQQPGTGDQGKLEESYGTILEFAKDHEEDLGESIATVSRDMESAADDASSAVDDLGTKMGEVGAASQEVSSGFGDLGSATDALIEKFNNANVKGSSKGGDGGGDGGGGEAAAFGGRYSRQRTTTVAEGNQPEYIIPITKTDRAVTLVRQMLSEMGSAAVHRVISGLGIGEAGTLGYSMGTMGSALSGMSMNNVYNISAPVNINVNASGASAEDIGKSAYNAAERHLVKTLTGVNG